jgi:DNA-binding transcriptional ArsR family regulator
LIVEHDRSRVRSHCSSSPMSSYDDIAAIACAGWPAALIYNQMVVETLALVETLPSETAEQRTDRLFHALADSTRRDIVMRALDGEHSVSALARLYPMSFAAVQKHVAVLEGAGLVTKRRQGREQLVSGSVDKVRDAYRLLEKFEEVWRSRIDRFGAVLADDLVAGDPINGR